MKQILITSFFVLFSLSMWAQDKMNMMIGHTTITVELENNAATVALRNRLKEGTVTITTSRYGGFEQVGSFPWSLPTDHQQITSQPGDVILYGSNQLVIFFGSNSWSYTRLGRISGLSNAELHALLNVPNCNVVLSLPNATPIRELKTHVALDASAPTYNLAGQRVNGSYKGLVVQNGRKYRK